MRTILTFFLSTSQPKFKDKWPISSGEEAKNRFFKIAAMAAILDFRSKRI